jgi:hypothetical protein
MARRWTDAEGRVLAALAPLGALFLSKALSRTVPAIHQRASKLGVKLGLVPGATPTGVGQ